MDLRDEGAWPVGGRRQQQVAGRRSRLVETFSEFLAARNVINRSSIYDKIVNDCNDHQQEQEEPPVAKWAPSSKRRPPGRTGHLLAALFSRRHQNKGWLLVRLLRAPVVLAALFSLLLVATLMVLYALMGVHQHRLAAERHHLSGRQLNGSRERDEEPQLSDFERALAVQTECGTYVGAPEHTAIVFRGIPYASPPVGGRRWTRPRPLHLDPELCRPNTSRLARRNARHRSHCAQLSPISKRFSGHEDCLYLDIYSARLDPVKKLPVMVYIHGGFLAYGTGRQPEEPRADQVNWHSSGPSGELASELEVILVAFNFRLQALGFLTLEELAQNNGPDGAMGNYGLWDQLAALQWVQRNIGAFGGDPQNVILFGPDSASALPLAAANQPAPGVWPDWSALFRAAWLVNPAVYYELPYELASRHYRRLFLNKDSPCAWQQSAAATHQPPVNGSSPVGCLLGLSAEQVSRFYLAKDDPSYRLDDQNCMPIHGIFADQFVTVERELVQHSTWLFGRSRQLEQAASDAAGASSANQSEAHQAERPKRAWLLGSSAQATQYWACPRDLHLWKWQDFQRYVSTSLSSFSRDAYAEAARAYGLPGQQLSPEQLYLTMVSDIRQMCPAGDLAAALRQSDGQVHRYVVETAPSEPIWLATNDGQANDTRQLKFAFHQWDLIAFFGFKQLKLAKTWTPSEQDLRFQRQIRQMVAEFVHDKAANNNSDTLFTKDAKQLPLPQKPSKYKAAECQMWRQQLGSSYAWVT